MFNFIRQLFQPSLGGRSPQWRKVRKEHLKKHPRCAITGSKKKLEVHHIKDYSTYPELELSKKNLVTLSRNAMGCNIHLLFGHLGNYKKINENIAEDIKIWSKKLK
jgi:hypothetical protein